jgi:hypothetical protein
MAIFHLSAKVISLGKGQSAIAAAAYRSGERLYDEQAAQQKYYPSRDERIVFTDIMAPKDAPEWAHDRDQLWNHAERAEKRKDAQLAREIEVSLPHELNDRQREWLIKDFAREQFVRKGYVVDIAIHAPDKTSDDRNYHAHLMVTMRTLGPDGFAVKKDPAMNRREQLGEWREKWAHLVNRHLERHGHEARIDHRSLKEQGIDREATVHLGYAASEMAQRGAQSDRMDAMREILARNEIRVDMNAIEAELRTLENEQAKQERQAAAERAATEQASPPPAQEPQPSREARSEGPSPETAKTSQAEPAPYVPTQWGMSAAYQHVGPIVPIEDINARHAAAERDRQQADARKQSVETAPQQPQQQREARADQTQKNWSMHRDAEVARVKDAAPPRRTGGLQVMNRATGVAVSLGDFVSNLLAGSPAQPAEPKVDMKAFATDPAARKRQQLGRLAAAQREKDSDKAIESIREDMEAGRNLKPENIAQLTRQHQEQIFSKGDDYVRQMVDDARKRADSYWKGRERERE